VCYLTNVDSARGLRRPRPHAGHLSPALRRALGGARVPPRPGGRLSPCAHPRQRGLRRRHSRADARPRPAEFGAIPPLSCCTILPTSVDSSYTWRAMRPPRRRSFTAESSRSRSRSGRVERKRRNQRAGVEALAATPGERREAIVVEKRGCGVRGGPARWRPPPSGADSSSTTILRHLRRPRVDSSGHHHRAAGVRPPLFGNPWRGYEPLAIGSDPFTGVVLGGLPVDRHAPA
jgi:hypothetical protein